MLFHAFYDVDYQFLRNLPAPANPCLYNVMPVDALQLDGRVVALSTYQSYDPGYLVYGSRRIHFNERDPCKSSRHAINVFLYGLIDAVGRHTSIIAPLELGSRRINANIDLIGRMCDVLGMIPLAFFDDEAGGDAALQYIRGRIGHHFHRFGDGHRRGRRPGATTT